MPTVGRFNGIRFVLRPLDHDPPHVHAFAEGCDMAIEIWTGRVLAGSLPSGTHEDAVAWVIKHSEMLYNAWKDTRPER